MKSLPLLFIIVLFGSFSLGAQEVEQKPTRDALIKSIQKEIDTYHEKLNQSEVHKDDTQKKFNEDIVQYLQIKISCYQSQSEQYADEKQCVETYKSIAEDGNLMAQEKLGNLYMNALKDNENALYWFEKALKNPILPNKDKVMIEKTILKLKNSP